MKIKPYKVNVNPPIKPSGHGQTVGVYVNILTTVVKCKKRSKYRMTKCMKTVNYIKSVSYIVCHYYIVLGKM